MREQRVRKVGEGKKEGRRKREEREPYLRHVFPEKPRVSGEGWSRSAPWLRTLHGWRTRESPQHPAGGREEREREEGRARREGKGTCVATSFIMPHNKMVAADLCNYTTMTTVLAQTHLTSGQGLHPPAPSPSPRTLPILALTQCCSHPHSSPTLCMHMYVHVHVLTTDELLSWDIFDCRRTCVHATGTCSLCFTHRGPISNHCCGAFYAVCYTNALLH